jgi:hypothetical protein
MSLPAVHELVWKSKIKLFVNGNQLMAIAKISEPTPSMAVNRVIDLDRDVVGYAVGNLQYEFSFSVYAVNGWGDALMELQKNGTAFTVTIQIDSGGSKWDAVTRTMDNCMITRLTPPTYQSTNLAQAPMYEVAAIGTME